MSRLSGLLKVIFVVPIFVLWMVGYEKYVGEDNFIEYWSGFDE